MKIRPIAGNYYMRFDEAFRDTFNGIVIPERARKRRTKTGIIIDIAFRQGDESRIGINPVGKKCVVIDCGARPVPGTDLHTLPTLDGGELTILAVLNDVQDVSASSDHVPRCRLCGPAASGSANATMLLQDAAGNWHCPRCRRYDDGSPYSEYALKRAG